MEKKNLNHIALIGAAAVFLLVAILYFASAGTARMVANSIDSGIKTLVENSDGEGGGIALFLASLGVGASVAVAFLLKLLGGIHIAGAFVTAVQTIVVIKADEHEKKALSRGFTIWALVRFLIYIVIHGLVLVFLGINVRSALLAVGLLVFTVLSIVSMVMDSKKKKLASAGVTVESNEIHT